jgi:hypothetical protein
MKSSKRSFIQKSENPANVSVADTAGRATARADSTNRLGTDHVTRLYNGMHIVGGVVNGASTSLEGLPQAVLGFLPDRPVPSDLTRRTNFVSTGQQERMIDLGDTAARKVVIADLVRMVEQGDRIAPGGSIIGVHLDNVHRLSAVGLATVFNEFLMEVETARQQGRISKTRKVGYVAKNNPRAFSEALHQKLLDAPPLYLINENARLNEDGVLNGASRVAQDIGRRCNVPVFLMTFGSDVAFTIEQNGRDLNVAVSKEMARQMAQMPNVSGVAWSVDEGSYHPTLFVQGSPVPDVSSDPSCRD